MKLNVPRILSPLIFLSSFIILETIYTGRRADSDVDFDKQKRNS